MVYSSLPCYIEKCVFIVVAMSSKLERLEKKTRRKYLHTVIFKKGTEVNVIIEVRSVALCLITVIIYAALERSIIPEQDGGGFHIICHQSLEWVLPVFCARSSAVQVLQLPFYETKYLFKLVMKRTYENMNNNKSNKKNIYSLKKCNI